MVAHTLHNFGDGVEAMPAYLGMMEFNPCKCAMAANEGIPGLQLRLCCHLENPWHLVPAADSVPYLGLQLQPDGEFSLQLKHRLRQAVVQHWCLNTLAPPKVVQDVILVILAGVAQYATPFISDNSDTAHPLDHITNLPGGCPAPLVFRARLSPAPPLVCGLGLQRRRVSPAVALVGEGGAQGPGEPVVGLGVGPGRKGQSEVHLRRHPRQPAGQPNAGAHAGANTVPAGGVDPCGHACPPLHDWCARRGHKICSWKSLVHIASAPRCNTPSHSSRPWRGVTGSTEYPGPWPPWEWGSAARLSAAGRPTSSCSPPRAMTSRCVPQSCDTPTHAA